MAKIKLHDINENGKTKEYILEYDKASVLQAERWGFDIEKLDSQPMTQIQLLIMAGFVKNHSDESRQKIEKVIDRIKDKDKLVKKLVELYQEPYNEMFNKSDDGKNSNWEVEE